MTNHRLQHGEISKSASRRWRTLLLFGVAAAALAAFLVWQTWFPGRAFDPQRWQDRKQISQGVRLPMAERLVARRTLIGLTREQVVAMLGKPIDTVPSVRQMRYWLAHESRWTTRHSVWLLLWMSDEGRVVDQAIRWDSTADRPARGSLP